MTLGEMIQALRALPQTARVGLTNPHSYRGHYEDLAFERCLPRPVADVVADAEASLGEAFAGYKGGQYVMSADSEVCVATYGHLGDCLTPEFFAAEAMRGDLDALRVQLAARTVTRAQLREAMRRAFAEGRAWSQRPDNHPADALDAIEKEVAP